VGNHIFDKNQKEFPSQVHEHIHNFTLKRTPLSVSLANIDNIPENVVKSCKSYYTFVEDLLADMYDNPTEYGFHPGALEAFFNGRKIKIMVRRERPKELNKLLDSEPTVSSYMSFFRWLGCNGEATETCMTIPIESLNNHIKTARYIGGPVKNKESNQVYKQKMKALQRVGFHIDENDTTAFVYSDKYPDMFLALQLLSRQSYQIRVFGEQGFFSCEFRQIFSQHVPDYDDVLQPLDNTKRAFIDKLHQFLIGSGCKDSYDTFWKINYSYKGKHLFYVGIEGSQYDLRVTGVYNWENKELFIQMLEAAEDPQFRRFILRALNYCSADRICKEKIGQFVNIMGKKKRLCHVGVGFRLSKFNEVDIDYIKQLFQIRFAFTDEQLSQNKKKTQT